MGGGGGGRKGTGGETREGGKWGFPTKGGGNRETFCSIV